MKTLALTSPGRLEIIERDSPVCGDFDALIAVEFCGVCRTDRKAFSLGQRDLHLPRVLGHEITGTILEMGSGVQGFSVGDRVQAAPGVFCGVCDYCVSGLDNLCDHMRILGFHLDGGFAEAAFIPGNRFGPGLLRIPDGLDSRIASLTEPLACCVNILKRLHIRQGDRVVIFGGGRLGILNAALARHLGAGRILLVEPLEGRRALAAPFCDLALDFNSETKGRILDFTEGKGADVVLPCCPGADAFLLGLEVAAKRGRVGFFSGLTDSSGLTAQALNEIHYRELAVAGSYGCSFQDNREALELLASRSVRMENLPFQDIDWEELPETLSSLDAIDSINPKDRIDHIFTYFKP